MQLLLQKMMKKAESEKGSKKGAVAKAKAEEDYRISEEAKKKAEAEKLFKKGADESMTMKDSRINTENMKK